MNILPLILSIISAISFGTAIYFIFMNTDQFNTRIRHNKTIIISLILLGISLVILGFTIDYIVEIYKELLLKYNVGTSYPVIKDDDVLNLVIPIIDISIQNKIEEKIKKSFLLKEESKRLLDLAKKAVEIAIEKDENEAMKFMEEKIKWVMIIGDMYMV